MRNVPSESDAVAAERSRLRAAGAKPARRDAGQPAPARQPDGLRALQANVGNAGIQQLLAPGGVRRRLGEGAPLPGTLRSEHERRFGVDLAAVRVHDGAPAHRLAQGEQARAFALGNDIVFNQDFYRPGTHAGRHLIAHELAHVVQQRGGGAPGGPAHEAAAHAAADAATRGGSGPMHAGPPAAPGIQREPLAPADKRAPESSSNGAGTADQPVATVMQQANAELANVSGLVGATVAGASLDMGEYALSDLRQLDAQLGGDVAALEAYEPFAGHAAGDVAAAKARFQTLRQLLAPTLAGAIAWHEANPMGESLGMMNERVGTEQAGEAREDWDKGGVRNRAAAAVHIAGAAAVATLDAAEKIASMGFHDAATAVAQAYARGDISWNEGVRILASSATRALAIAAVSGGVGALATRTLALRAIAAGAVTTSLRYGITVGASSGALASAAGLATQAVVTKGLEGLMHGEAGKSIWKQGMPTGTDWALGIPLGMVMGGLWGGRSVESASRQLVGTVIQTPSGPMRIKAILKVNFNAEPNVVLGPVDAPPIASATAPKAAIDMVFDPASNSWVSPDAAPPGGSVRSPPGSGATAPAKAAPAGRAGPAGNALAPTGGNAPPRLALPAPGTAELAGKPAAGTASAAGAGKNVTVFRVQGGTPPDASWELISIDKSGNPRISRTTLNVSVGDPAHAQYFLSKRPGASISSFEIPQWMNDFIEGEAIPQAGYRSNPANQGGRAPKIVDPSTPGRSYELPAIWAKWLQEVAIPGSGKVTKGGAP